MHKRWMLLVLASLMLFQITGCGKKNEETTEIVEESAVDNTTADSDDIQEVADLPEVPSKVVDEGSAKEPAYMPGNLMVDLPKGFVAYEDEEGMYVHKSYPKDLSSISYVISESTEDVTEIKQEDYQAMLEADFLANYGDDVTVNISMYKDIRVDGRDGLKIMLNYEFKGVVYEQLIYMVYNGDESHILSFTQEEGSGWMDEFEACGDSISLVTN